MPLTPFGILTFDDVDAGLDAAAKKPAMLARQITSVQSLVNNTPTTLTYNSVEFDNDSIAVGASGSVANMSRAGLWEVKAVVEFASNATGVREATIMIDGLPATVGSPTKTIPAISGSPTLVELTRTYELVAGQDVQIRGRQTSGAGLNTFLAEFSVHLITDAA